MYWYNRNLDEWICPLYRGILLLCIIPYSVSRCFLFFCLMIKYTKAIMKTAERKPITKAPPTAVLKIASGGSPELSSPSPPRPVPGRRCIQNTTK